MENEYDDEIGAPIEETTVWCLLGLAVFEVLLVGAVCVAGILWLVG